MLIEILIIITSNVDVSEKIKRSLRHESNDYTSQRKLEAKASSHEGQCIPAGSNVSLPRRVLIILCQ